VKKTLFSVGTVIAILALAILAWTNLAPKEKAEDTDLANDITSPGAEDDAQNDDAGEDQETEDVADIDDDDDSASSSELTLLPLMNAGQDTIGAGGGGREGAVAPAPAQEGAVAEMSMIIAPDFGQTFVDATFTLNATLPVEPATATVLQHTYDQIELAEAQRIAEKFGFAGPLYTERFDFEHHIMIAEEPVREPSSEEGSVSVARPPAEEEIPFEPPTVYHAFDGKRHLSIFEDATVYVDRSILEEFEAEVPNAMQIAEAFLQERGLLDFPYQLEEGFGSGEVHVRRLIDGVLLDDPEIYIRVSSAGEIIFANDRTSSGIFANLGNYPLMAAESAWQLILEDVVGNNISFNIMPDFESFDRPISRPDFERPQYWQRQIEPGSEAHLYSGAMVYQRADGEGPPRLELNELVLNGSDEELEAIAEQVGQMIHVWGQVGDDNATLNLAGWEPLPDPPHFSGEGHIQRTADQVLFLSSTGETYILPGAPVDLPDGMRVNLFAWASREAGLAYPVLDWQNIDEWFDYSVEPISAPMPEPAVVEDNFVDPYQFSEIVIDEVKLAYMRVFDFEGFDKQSRPPEFVQPAWEFSGVTDNGDRIVLRVQAVDAEYLRTSGE
jgi:hypothetical protein